MLKEMFAQDYQGKAFLIFGVKYTDTLLYDKEFRSYLVRPNFRYTTALSREEETNPFPDQIPTRENKMYVQVRMWQHREEIRRSLEKPDTAVYICGLKGMERGIFRVIDRIAEQNEDPRLLGQIHDEGRLLLEVY